MRHRFSPFRFNVLKGRRSRCVDKGTRKIPNPQIMRQRFNGYVDLLLRAVYSIRYTVARFNYTTGMYGTFS